MKANINSSIHVKIFAWEEHRIIWTKNTRRNRPIKKLAAHLKEIIGLEAVLELPNELPTDVLTPHRDVLVQGGG